MSAFTLSKKAKADLKTIAIYTQKRWGKAQREIYIRQFDNVFHMLAETPELGKPCDFIKPGYRKFPVSNHLVFYRRTGQFDIEFVRILHKRMDVETHF